MTEDTRTEPFLTSRYRLIEQIGVGGMGLVYRAFDRLHQQEIALKRVFVSAQTVASRGDDLPGSLMREFQILASLRHPHIISVLEYGFDAAGIPYLTMDLLHDAEDIVTTSRQVKELDTRLRLLNQMLLALSYLHRRGILHRDLKPSNVLVKPEQEVKLLDFGLAQQDTRSAGVVGTLPYSAPEVLTNGRACVTSDLFSVGVMAYQMLTGIHPFEGQTTSETINRILHQAPALEPLRELPEALQAVILRLLEKEPEQRYCKARDVIHALGNVSPGARLEETTAYRDEILYTPAFAGREKWLRSLNKSLQALPTGGSTYLISGVSGVGKSRLLHELRIEAAVQGISVLSASGSEVPHVEDGIWRELLPALLLLVSVEDAEASVLKSFVPNIEQLLERPVADAPELAYRKDRQRLTKTLLTIFKRLEHPLLLYVDDLQWATDEELLPLQQLHKTAPDVPLMLVFAYRSDEAPYLYGKFPLASQIALEPLNHEEIKEIVRKVLGARDDLDDIVVFLHYHTGGNALFLVEVLRIMAEDAGGIEQIRTEEFPAELASLGVVRVLKRRLRHVPLNDHVLLRLAALLGQEINFPVLQAYDDQVDYESWLLRAADAAILTVQDGIWHFTHDKVREAMLDGLDGSYLRKLHGMAAQAMERFYGENPAYIKAIAEHWRSAGRLDREISYMPALAERLNEQGFHTEALELLERGLPYASEHAAVSSHLVATLHVLASHSYTSQGQLDPAQQHLEAALERVRQEDDPNLYAQILAGLGSVAGSRGDFPTATQQLDQAITIFRTIEVNSHFLTALNNRAIVAAKTGDLDRATTLFQEVLVQREQRGDIFGQAAVLINIGNLARIQYQSALALDCFKRSLEMAEAEEWYSVAAGALNNLGQIAIEDGDYVQAMAYLLRARPIAEKTGSHQRIILNEYHLGMIAYFQQDYDQSHKHFQVAYRIAHETDSRYELLQTTSTYTHVAFAQGDQEQGRKLFKEVLSLAIALGEPFLFRLPLYSAVAVALDVGANELAAEWLAFLLTRFEPYEIRYRHLSLYVQPRLQEQIGEKAWKLAQIHSKYLDLPRLIQQLHRQFVSQP